jgi:serine/threonine-protein kinase
MHDIGVYVSGQRILCQCGIHFAVKRTDVAAPTMRPGEVASNYAPVPSDSDAQVASVERTVGPASVQAVSVASEEAHSGNGNQTFVGATAKLELPGYDLLEVLGRGGMGEVWRARQRSLGREVAVKILPPKQSKDKESIARFEKEATALASLNHPHIVQIIDRGTTGEHYYFVMEYVHGLSLRELINGRSLSPTEAVKLTIQICQAIGYAHEKQIIHRDLKPENILVDEKGRLKVADFGLAGISNSDARLQLTATRVAMGTVNYMAPEQRRDAKNVDGRADLYSVGVILYEMLTGDLPLGRFKLPSERIKPIDSRLDPVVAKALETDPAARYARAEQMAEDLEQLVSTAPVQTASASREQPTTLVPASKQLPAPESTPKALLRTGWRGLRVALTVVGALVVIGLLIRWGFGPVSVEVANKDGQALIIGTSAERAHFQKHGHLGAGRFPPNTNGSLLASAHSEEMAGLTEVALAFSPGTEEVSAYAGSWKLEDGKLKATQAGNDTGGQKLIPRAYLTRHFFSSDDFAAEVEMTFRDLENDFPAEENAQHYGELAFRFKDLQISAFAIDDQNMRLLWRYTAPDGTEFDGNSAQDWEKLVEDEMPIPPDGTPFRVRLTLKRRKGGTEVEGFLNGERFARKILVGLEGRTGRVALGCRSLHCEFRNLWIRGKQITPPDALQLASQKPE